MLSPHPTTNQQISRTHCFVHQRVTCPGFAATTSWIVIAPRCHRPYVSPSDVAPRIHDQVRFHLHTFLQSRLPQITRNKHVKLIWMHLQFMTLAINLHSIHSTPIPPCPNVVNQTLPGMPCMHLRNSGNLSELNGLPEPV
jgi:hypothetical protein